MGNQSNLQVLSPREAGGAGAGFAKAALIAEVGLAQSGAAFSGSPKAASLAAGYLEPLPTELVRTPNKQVGPADGLKPHACRLPSIATLSKPNLCQLLSAGSE